MSKEELRAHWQQKKSRSGAAAMARHTRAMDFKNKKAYTRKQKHKEFLCL